MAKINFVNSNEFKLLKDSLTQKPLRDSSLKEMVNAKPLQAGVSGVGVAKDGSTVMFHLTPGNLKHEELKELKNIKLTGPSKDTFGK